MLYILFYFTGFCSIIIYSLTHHNIYVFKTLITILVSILIFISITKEIGGDLENYERYFYGLKQNEIIFSHHWLYDYFKLFFKLIFNETAYEAMPLMRNGEYRELIEIYNQTNHYGFKFYKLITCLIYMAGTFSLFSATTYNNRTSIFLVLLLPVSMVFMMQSIEQCLSLGIVFFALSRIQKSKLVFFILVLLAGSFHWSSYIFLPIIFYDKRLFQYLLILSLILTSLLVTFNNNLVQFIINTLTILSSEFGVNFLYVFLDNITISEYSKVKRSLSWHHIYLSTFFVFCAALCHMRLRNFLNLKNQKDSILLLTTLMILLIVSLIFKDTDVWVARIAAPIKILSLICFVNAVYIFNKHTQIIYILLGLNFAILGVYTFA
ncbi:EpsG family protein [Candidatus Thioglobus sp.]|nr:EpsG family protein [Candidatus Thioglobus sp.]MDA8872031.1 EpsG family protein [Candidatus Thioglobus sp.]